MFIVIINWCFSSFIAIFVKYFLIKLYKLKLLAKCFHGLEDILAKELEDLGATNITKLKRAVSFDGNKELIYKANLWSRTALRILQPLTTFRARNEDELYKQIKDYKWESYLNVDQTLAIDAVTFSRFFKHSHYAGLKAKDAICDRFRDLTGERPSVDVDNPNLLINVHIAEDRVSISLDSSAEPLNRRGYRTKNHPAPINESLAAGMLLMAGYDGSRPFLDPMCGSGTIVIEAALIAANIAPGLKRKSFGFMRWNNFDKELWQKLLDEAKESERYPQFNIGGSDISPRAIDIAKQTTLDYGIKQFIDFRISAFKDAEKNGRNGLIVMNPPYDERLKSKDIINLYGEVGNKLKHTFTGWDVWVISANFDALKSIGLRPEERNILFNGSLECRFNKYNLFEGKRVEQLKRRNLNRRES